MIRLQVNKGVARLTLDRPDVRNALAMSDWESLAALAGEVRTSNARLLIVGGAGGAFCAGADLSEFDRFQADPSERTRFRCVMRSALDALCTLPVPTIAQVEGPCFGAGVAVAMACDIRIAAPDARFAITPAKMGIGYPQEDVARLVTLVGPGWASRLLFGGSPIDAAQAERVGLVQGVGGVEEADRLAAEIAACDPASIAMLKRGIALGERGIVQDDAQDQAFEALLGSPALTASLSRRRSRDPLPPAQPPS